MEDDKTSLPSQPSLNPDEAADDVNHDAVQPPKPKRKKWLWLGLAVVLIGAAAAYWFFVREDEPQASINSYDECVAAGYPVMESYPEQCAVPGGQTFTRQLSDEEQRNLQETEGTTYQSEKGVEIILDSPVEEEQVSSPLTVSGKVPGSWSFEGVFPIKLVDSQGKTVAETQGRLDGNWMTDELVTFNANLEFDLSSGSSVKLVLAKDNPSGLSENDDSVRINLLIQ